MGTMTTSRFNFNQPTFKLALSATGEIVLTILSCGDATAHFYKGNRWR